MPSGYFGAWLAAFLFTQLIEIPIYRVGLLHDRRWPAALAGAAGASAITHPLLWFVIFPYLPLGYWWTVLVGELFVWAVEAGYFMLLFRARRAWLWSFVANATSLGMGLLSRRWFGAP